MQLYRILLLIIYKKIWSFHFIYVILLHIIMTYRLLLLLLPLLFMTSCQDGRWRLFGLSAEEEEQVRLSLSLADSLMEDNPDSAMAVLRHDSALVLRADISERMMYALLKTQADDKLYVTHKSDSTIREVAKYFNEHGDTRQQAQAWYLLGRVSYDLQSKSTAISAFENSLGVEGEDSVVCIYKSLSATWISVIFEEKSLYKLALSNRKKANEYAVKTGNVIYNIYTLRDIGRSYSNMGKNIKAIKYYQEAEKLTTHIDSPYIYNMVMEELAYTYIKEGMMEHARRALSTPIAEDSPSDIMSRKYIWGYYYKSIGRSDSALIFYKESLANATMSEKVNILRDMGSLEEKLGEKSEALKYIILAQAYSDTLRQMEVKEYQDIVDNVNEKLEIQRHSYKLANDRKNLLIFVGLIIFIVILVGCMLYYIHTKHKKERMEQDQRMRLYWERREQESQNRIMNNEEHIRVLERELSASSENFGDIVIQLKETEKALLEADSQIVILKQKQDTLMELEFQKSDIYLHFHDINYKPLHRDFIQLEESLNKTYNGFTVRLRNLYPSINIEELQICCMVKIRLTPKEMCSILGWNANTLGMKRKRLYKKITNKDGGASDLDNLILNL